MPPKWVNAPKDVECVAGQSIVIDCQARAHPNPRVWLVSGNRPFGGDLLIFMLLLLWLWLKDFDDSSLKVAWQMSQAENMSPMSAINSPDLLTNLSGLFSNGFDWFSQQNQFRWEIGLYSSREDPIQAANGSVANGNNNNNKQDQIASAASNALAGQHNLQQQSLQATANALQPPNHYRTIISNSRIHILENASLVIRDVHRLDQGYYLCQAANNFGSLSALIKLTVNGKDNCFPTRSNSNNPRALVFLGLTNFLICKITNEFSLALIVRKTNNLCNNSSNPLVVAIIDINSGSQLLEQIFDEICEI